MFATLVNSVPIPNTSPDYAKCMDMIAEHLQPAQTFCVAKAVIDADVSRENFQV